ncbi:MAG TPA: DSD1 family PLP-dependent enzyme [Chloroflexota bacterium]|nr:DSD1 family PLP-dependent enzyme [Chloroflexota bacterium]
MTAAVTADATPIGRPLAALDTPALVVDLGAFERNVERMAETIVRRAGVRWRPHIKGLKTPPLVQPLLAAGARGITCAKLGEAEVMAAAGITDILIANQIVGETKIARLVALRRRADLTDLVVAVDDAANVDAIDRAAREAGTTVRLVIEVDTGMGRAGVAPGEPVLTLARHIASRDGVRFAGLMTWESVALRIQDPQEKRRAVEEAVGAAVASARRCAEAGLPVEIVSCGGTGTYWLSAFLPGVTEIQAGGGALSDLTYQERLGVPHECALTVLTTVTSRPTPTRIICDAGRKALSTDGVLPRPLGLPPVAGVRFSAEHGIVELAAPSAYPRPGETFQFLAGYADTTIPLHEELYAVREGTVAAVWPILARGKLR